MALSSISAILCVGAIEDAHTVCGHSSHKKGTVSAEHQWSEPGDNVNGPVTRAYVKNLQGHQNAPITGPVRLVKNNALENK